MKKTIKRKIASILCVSMLIPSILLDFSISSMISYANKKVATGSYVEVENEIVDEDIPSEAIIDEISTISAIGDSSLITTMSDALKYYKFGAVSSTTGKRPIWIQSHHCNSRTEVQQALDSGCNAIEIDVKFKDAEGTKDHGKSAKTDYPNPTNFWLAHSNVTMRYDMSIAEIIENAWECRNSKGEHLCFIMLDIKDPEYIPLLNKEIHEVYDYYYKTKNEQKQRYWNILPYETRRFSSFLNPANYGKKLYIIYSMADSKNIDMFKPNLTRGYVVDGKMVFTKFELRENEGVCVDMSTDVNNIEKKFAEFGYENCWFGNGLDFNVPDFIAVTCLNKWGKVKSIEDAVKIRNKSGSRIKKVESWTVANYSDAVDRLYKLGCDSIMVADRMGRGGANSEVNKYIVGNAGRFGCYMATIEDNPFERSPKYNVEWYDYDGTLLYSEDFSCGADPKIGRREPSHPWMEFVGWKSEFQDYIGLEPVTRNVRYTAVYKELARPLHRLTFRYMDRKIEQLVEEDRILSLYKVNDWAKSVGILSSDVVGWKYISTGEIFVDMVGPIKEDMIFLAETTTHYYNITFKIANKTIHVQEQYYHMPDVPNIPPEGSPYAKEYGIPAGYEFLGWVPEIDLVTEDREYTARFENKVKVKLYIDTGEYGKPMEPIIVGKGEIPIPPKDLPERVGCDFDGYYKDEACTKPYKFDEPLNNNLTIYVKWKIAHYKIKWMIGGDSEEVTVEAGTIPTHATPSMPMSIFTGWTPEIEEAYSDMTYTANFALAPHVVTLIWPVHFDTMGGSAIGIQRVYDNSKAQKPLYDPIKKGYDFDGWYANKECTGSPFDFNTLITHEITLYAKWKIKEYTITYKELKKSGSELVDLISTQKVQYGKLPDKTPTALDGYKFIGWKPDLVLASEDATYIAEYIKDTVIDVYHVVDFDPMGGVASPSYLIVKDNEKIATIPEATRTGYIFNGWYANKECTGSPFDFSSIPITADDMTLYAKWTATTHKVIWKKDGSVIASNSYLYGEMPDWGKDCGGDVEKPGYEFLGWDPILESVGLDPEYTYNAQYKLISLVIHYITFDTKGGSYVNMQVISDGEKVATPSIVPAKKGYTFKKWYKNESCTTEFKFSVETISADTTIYAGWEANTYTVHWLKEKEEKASCSCAFDTVPVFPAEKEVEFNKIGYTRTGWSPSVTKINEYSGEDIYYEAVYSESEYGRHYLIFDTRGGSAIAPQNILEGYQAVRPENPTRRDYTFTDWYNEIECTSVFDFYTPIATDTTIYAGWIYRPEPIPISHGSSSGGGGGGGTASPKNISSRTLKSNAILCNMRTTDVVVKQNEGTWIYDVNTNKWYMAIQKSGQISFLNNNFYNINGCTYYFDKDGSMITGWVKDIFNNYYMFETEKNNDEGKMVTGWKKVNNNWYFFQANGIMLTYNFTPDGYFVDAAGICIDNNIQKANENEKQSIIENDTSTIEKFGPQLK